ncbi:MAG TPA: ABC transporter permease [bacterium]|nr:ABC transporter permease [bacterium]
MKERNKALQFVINNGVYIVLVLMFIYFSVSCEGFFTAQNLANIPMQIAFVVIIATGMTLVIITGGIDISVGCIVALNAVIFSLLLENYHMAIPLAIVLSLLLGSVTGLISGYSIVKFNVPPFIATLAMMTIARGAARYISGNTKIFINGTAIEKYTHFVTGGNIGGIPYLVIFMLIVVVIFGVILKKTRFGRYVLADGGNEEATKLSGIDVGKVKILVYVINASLAGLVGILMAFKFTNGNPEFGVMWELDAIAAVVVGGASLLGGKGDIFKTFLGALLIGVLDNGLLIKGLSSEMIYMIKGVIILGAVIVDQIKGH